MMFTIGQKVCCIDAPGSVKLMDGQIYTVTKIYPRYYRASGQPSRENRNDDGIEVAEVSIGTPFFAGRFRPIVSRATDISVFHKILAKASKRVSA